MEDGSRESGTSVYKILCLVTQSYPTLCDPMDYTVHRILQARILEWVAVSLSGVLPNPGIKLRSPALQVDSLLSELPGELVVTQSVYYGGIINCSHK